MIELWTALVIGLGGSLHCIGMCGPIALALPAGSRSRLRLVISRLVYNFGRIVTYAVLGALTGLIGETIAMIGFQRGVSIASGVIIIAAVALPSKYLARFLPSSPAARLVECVKSWWGKLFANSSMASLFSIGLLNGLLPCGFLYVALAASAATGSTTNAISYMVLFGLGTMPALVLASLFGPMLGGRVRQRINRLLPVGAIVLGLLLVLRGMSLGIPYVSPDLEKMQAKQETHCH